MMVHSVELLFDADTEAAVRRIWDDLAEAGVRSQAGHTAPSNRPHVTLAVAETMDSAVDEALRPLLQQLPITCTVGAPMLFGRRQFTLVRLIVPSVPLLSLQADIHDACLPHAPQGPLPHSQPGQWTPHVTLARRVPAEQLQSALTMQSVSRELSATGVGIRHWDGNAKREYPI
jgi:2'-5' RNA ligase